MGRGFDDGVACMSIDASAPISTGWQQAGFVSFAYRLAHLTVPRGQLLSALFALFYFV
ncbi:MAG: hypothetical protein JWR75_287 [Devosia sp.]|nr:hypothetical protein [Devosia sp.]